MATYHATILQIGDLIQRTEKFSNCEVELQVGEESKTVMCPRWHRGKLQVGQTYELTVEENNFGENITDVLAEKSTPTTVAPNPDRRPTTPATPQRPRASASTPASRPDFSGRWREWNMHARTAQMQATERVNAKMRALEKGLLVNEHGEPFTKVKLSTYDEWIQNQIDHYWDELEKRPPQDAYGDMVESESVGDA